MTGPYFHVGFLVGDLDAAMADFAETLGVTFEEPRTATVATGDRVRFVYSNEGPPFVELMEASGEGAWSLAQGEGFHHLGVSTPDMAGRQDALRRRGVDWLDVRVRDGATRVMFTEPAGLHGVRLELLTEEYVAGRTDPPPA